MCPKQQFDRIFPRKRKFLSGSLTLSKKLSACSTKFSDRIVKFALYVPDGTHSGKNSIFLHDFEAVTEKLSAIWWNDSGKVAEIAFYVSRGKFCGKLCFLKKILFSYIFSQQSAKQIFFELHLSLGNAFKAAFYVGEGKEIFSRNECVSPKFPDLEWKFWCSLANYWDHFIKTAFYVPCAAFSSRKFCLLFHQLSFLDICWKKLGFLAKSCWRLLCFPHLWQRCFLCLQRSVWVNFPPNNELFPLCKTEG